MSASTPVRAAVFLLLAGVLAVAALHRAPSAGVAQANDGGATYRLDGPSAERPGAVVLDAQTRAATFAFAADASAARASVLAAIAGAEPDARRLIGLVDGLVTVHAGAIGLANAVGLTSFDGRRYSVTIDIDQLQQYGVGAASATVLHELGHVIDRALVPSALVVELDAKIPTGFNCVPGQPTGACAPMPERFADTFARWAMNDASVNGTVGYQILPPVPISAWGRPLARLGVS